MVAPHYGLDGAPNFEGRHWHLRVTQPLAQIARARSACRVAECASACSSQRAPSCSPRAQQRVRPGRDEKILTSWNALMINGMARAARVFGRAGLAGLGAARARFHSARTLWRDGRLLATCKDGRAHLNAYLDDYAFLLDALLELCRREFRPAISSSRASSPTCCWRSSRTANDGGFFFTSHDHEQLIHRAKPGHDNATPSGNGVAAFALQRLGHLLGEPRYLDAAERALALFYPALAQSPGGLVSLPRRSKNGWHRRPW